MKNKKLCEITDKGTEKTRRKLLQNTKMINTMKRVIINIAAAAVLTAFNSVFGQATMTMTTASRYLSIELGGSGTAIINWGNGISNDTVTFYGGLSREEHLQ